VLTQTGIEAGCSSPKTENGSVRDIGTYGNQFKGRQSRIGNQINNSAFEAMMEAIQTDRTPNFYFMHPPSRSYGAAR
jgi:hypothetical protein